MSSVGSGSGFYQVGGALPPDADSYVQRPADELLPRQIARGEYCNVMAARQMGKSSLMARTAGRLERQGFTVACADLNAIGAVVTADQWYAGLLRMISRDLGLARDALSWWRTQGKSTPVQRFTRFVEDEILGQVAGPIAIFVDEIDSTLRLPFTDDFFAAIRSMYNERAQTAAYGRLAFVLIGVARPADLIKERKRTPYNIGYTMDLDDFSAQDARALLPGLERAYPDRSEAILERILNWTEGHPYLTQRLCAEVAVSRETPWSDRETDRLVEGLFFQAGQVRNELNLQRIDDYIRGSECRDDMLDTYREILAGRQVRDEERSIEKSYLKLSGLVKARPDGYLKVRNRIYERVFTREWIEGPEPRGILSCVRRLFRRRNR